MAAGAGAGGGIKRSFAPVTDERTRILVLGSLPGERSLAEQRYYANPRNHFWTLLGEVIERDLVALDYPDRLQALLDARIGLWDVVESAGREGSLDANIRGHRPNRLADLAASLPGLRALGFNGGTAAKIGRGQLPGPAGIALVALPSSSPAYTLPLAEKRLRWLQLRRWL
ncbi:MAG: DNA-deoxyinosine glycosylase [Sphingomonadales bacterium]